MTLAIILVTLAVLSYAGYTLSTKIKIIVDVLKSEQINYQKVVDELAINLNPHYIVTQIVIIIINIVLIIVYVKIV